MVLYVTLPAVAPVSASRSHSLNLFRFFLLPFLAAHLLFPLIWLVIVVQYGPRENDWLQFHLVAERFVSGHWTDLYIEGPESRQPGYLWRYPPYALYLVAPLAWMTRTWAYVLIAGVGIAALAASLVLMARLAPPREAKAEWVLATALSAPALATIITGQISALILLCLVGGVTLWSRGRLTAGSAVLALLATKPNIGIFLGFYVLARHQWHSATVMIVIVLVMCATTIPLGSSLWIDFFRISLANTEILGRYEGYKLITLKAFVEAVIGAGLIASALWLGTSCLLLVVAARAWRVPAPPIRHLGMVTLLAVAANPYASFYDALLLALPAASWWGERERWRHGPWITTGILIATAWCWEQSAYTWNELFKLWGIHWAPPFSVVGPVAAVWLLIAAREEIRAPIDSPRRTTPTTPYTTECPEARSRM